MPRECDFSHRSTGSCRLREEDGKNESPTSKHLRIGRGGFSEIWKAFDLDQILSRNIGLLRKGGLEPQWMK